VPDRRRRAGRARPGCATQRQIEQDGVDDPARQTRWDRPERQRQPGQDEQRPGQQTAQATLLTGVEDPLAGLGKDTETDQRMPAPRLAEQPVKAGTGHRRQRQNQRSRRFGSEWE
jgi:hypothetical protein